MPSRLGSICYQSLSQSILCAAVWASLHVLPSLGVSRLQLVANVGREHGSLASCKALKEVPVEEPQERCVRPYLPPTGHLLPLVCDPWACRLPCVHRTSLTSPCLSLHVPGRGAWHASHALAAQWGTRRQALTAAGLGEAT